MSNRIIYEGILGKYGGTARKKWQKRHCILRAHRLQYGVMDKDNQFKEKKHILKINALTVEAKNDDTKQLIFVLHVRDSSDTNSIRKFQFKAESTRVRDTWITQLTKWIGSNANQSDISVVGTNSGSTSPTSSTSSVTTRRRSTAINLATASVDNVESPSASLYARIQEKLNLDLVRGRTSSSASVDTVQSQVSQVSHVSSKTESTSSRGSDGGGDIRTDDTFSEKTDDRKSNADETDGEQSGIDNGYEMEDIKSREDKSELKRFEKIRDFFPEDEHENTSSDNVSNDGERINLKEKLTDNMKQFLDYALKEAQNKVKNTTEILQQQQQQTSSTEVKLTPKDQAQVEMFLKSQLKNEKIQWSRFCGREDPLKKNATELNILVLTDKHLYLVNPDTYEFVRKLELGKIKHILQSGYDQSIVSVVHTESDYDILLQFKMEKTKKSGESILSETKTYEKKIDFFDYVTLLYRMFTDSKGNKINLRIYFVNDVYALSRRAGTSGNKTDITSEKKTPKEVPKALRLNPVDILQINYRNDKIHIYNAPTLLKMISAFGDKEILFAGNVEKLNKNRKYQIRLLVISDSAIYLFANIHSRNVTRRIELDEVGELVRHPNNKDQLLIRIPDEYDLFIQSKLYVETICSVFKDLFSDPEDELIRVCNGSEDVLRFAVLEKTRAFKKKADLLDNYESIINSLRNAITQHNSNKMTLFIEYANMHENNHKTVPTDVQSAIKETARKELNKIKEQEMIKEGYAQALVEGNVLKIDEWTQKISQLKIVYEPLKMYLKKVERRKTKIMNKAAILSRIKYAIDHHLEANSKEIEDALDAALRAGFVTEVEEYKKIYELEIQRSVLPKQLEEAQKSHDVDKLLTIIESAKQTGIYSNTGGDVTVFQKAEQNLQDYINKKRISNSIMEAIEEAKQTNKTSSLDALCKKHLESHKWIETTPAYKAANKVIEDIKNFRVEILKLNKAVDMLEPKINEKSPTLLEKKTTDVIVKYIDRIDGVMIEKGLNLGKKDEKIMQRAKEALATVNQIVRTIKSEEASGLLKQLQQSIQNKAPESAQIKLIEDSKQYFEYNSELEALATYTESKLQTISELKTLDNNVYSFSHVEHINDLMTNAERFDLMTSEIDTKLQLVYERIAKEYDIYQNLRSALDASDTHLVKICIVEAMDYPAMDEILSEAKLYLNKKRIEEITIRKNLEKALKTDDLAKIMDITNQAMAYPNLDQLVRKAQSKLRGDDISESKIEEDIERFIITGDAQGLSDYIAQNENNIPSQLLKESKARLNKLRGESFTVEDIKQAMINATSTKDINELNVAIQNAEKMLLLGADERTAKSLNALLTRAREIQQKLQYTENIGMVKNIHDQFYRIDDEDEDNEFHNIKDPKQFTALLKKGVLYKNTNSDAKKEHAPTELIDRLITYVTQLRTSNADPNRFDEKLGKYRVQMHNKHAQNVVVVLSDVIAHKAKKRFFSQPKTPYEILKGLRKPEVQRVVDKFEALDLVQELSQEKQFGSLSVLFIHFLLSESQFMSVLSHLLTSDAYMKEVYDNYALLRGVAYRDEIYPYLSILNMFHFEFTLSSQNDVLIASPISKLKIVIRNVVQYFVSHKNDAQGNLKTVGTESWNEALGSIIRNELCNALLAIVTHKFKASGFFVKYSLWQLIEEAAENRKISAIDIGGLFLPGAVHYINEHVYISPDQKKNESELKFKALVCYCLNERALADVFETIFKDHELLLKYYEMEDSRNKKPLVMDSVTFKKACIYLKTLSKLPFDLYISGDGERILQQRGRISANGSIVYA
jgi:hypothetical protein